MPETSAGNAPTDIETAPDAAGDDEDRGGGAAATAAPAADDAAVEGGDGEAGATPEESATETPRGEAEEAEESGSGDAGGETAQAAAGEPEEADAEPDGVDETAADAGAEAEAEAAAAAGEAADEESAQAGAGEDADAAAKEEPDRESEPAGEAGGGSPPAKAEKPAESPEARFFRQAKEDDTILEGRVIGWNRGGFHVVINENTTFCPRSEMEVREPRKPASYVDQTLPFRVLKVQDRGRRVVVSRAAALKAEHARRAKEVLKDVEVGDVVRGNVASLADFGAFVDLGGVKGLVHVSEISRDQVDHPKDRLEVGQEVEVKVLKIQEQGRRISLSMKALEPDPWKGVRERYPEGSLVKGTVERTNRYGAFINLEPGLTGLLPSSEMKLPPDAQAARIFPPGKEVKVHVLSVDPRRRRISLGQEGSKAEGSAADLREFKKQQQEGSGGFNALAAAFKKLE